MSTQAIDPKPFESAMPQAVRQVIADARKGHGPAAGWLGSDSPGWGQVGDCFGLLRSELPPQIVGWLAGIGMFGDDLYAIPDVIVRERHRAVIPYVIDAFVAGVIAGQSPLPRQWKGIERLTEAHGRVPDTLAAIVARPLVSKRLLERAVGLKIAQKLGKKGLAAIEAALATTQQRKASRLLEEALANLRPKSGRASSGDAASVAFLQRLLEAWREHKHSVLAEAIDSLGKQLADSRQPLRARSKGELEGVWLALAAKKDSVDIERLLATPWPAAWKAARERVQKLAAFTLDPRIARALVQLARRYTSQASYPLHIDIAALLAEIADPQTADSAELLMNRRWINEEHYKAAYEAASAVRPTSPEQKLLSEASALVRPETDIAELWRAVWDQPQNIDARLVLADALQQRGDPRGELIVLQNRIAAGKGDREMQSRVRRLLEAHIDSWTGPLPGVVRASRRFENGFLAALRTNAAREELASSLERDEWTTLGELSVDNYVPASVLAKLLAKMPLLRRLFVLSTDGELATVGPFEGIEVLGAGEWRLPPSREPFVNLRAWCVVSGIYFELEEAITMARAAKLEALVLWGNAESGVLRRLAKLKDVGPELTITRPFLTYSSRRDMTPFGWQTQVRLGSKAAKLGWLAGERFDPGVGAALIVDLEKHDYREIEVCLPQDRQTKARFAKIEVELGQRERRRRRADIRYGCGPFNGYGLYE
jgi:uncharacterized protein (TIGR02996 family)